MKFEKIMLVTILLLAILSIGAVSAGEDLNDTLTVDDAQEEVIDTPVEEIDADDVLSYEASDFNVEISESVDLSDFEAPAVTFEAPSDAEGEIYISINSSDNMIYSRDLDQSPVTLFELNIESKGTYLVNVSFKPTSGAEIFLASGTINVTQILTEDSFDVRYEDDGIIGSLTLDIFSVYECPANGDLVVFVDGNKVYNESLSIRSYVELASVDLGIDGKKSSYAILAKFYTDDGEEFTLADFDAFYRYVDEDPSNPFDTDYILSEEFDPITDLSKNIFWLEDSPVAGNLVVYVDDKQAYTVPVSVNDNVQVKGSDLGITDYGKYAIEVKFNAADGANSTIEWFDLYYNAESFIKLYDVVDVSYHNTLIAFVYDSDLLNGIVTLSIDGKQYYNKQFGGTQQYVNIYDTDLDGLDIYQNFTGNYTVKVTYNDLINESVVSFEFLPYYLQPYEMGVGISSNIIFIAPPGSTGSASLYYLVYNDTIHDYEVGSLIGTYPISGSTSNVPLPPLTLGSNTFCVNFTINGRNNADWFRVEGVENSEGFTSSISASEIDDKDSLNVKVTGPGTGYVDIYVDGSFADSFLLNGTGEGAISNLTAGQHTVAIMFTSGDLYYANSFTVTVKGESGTTPAIDNSTSGDVSNGTSGDVTNNTSGDVSNDTSGDVTTPTAVDITNAEVILSKSAFTYNAKVQKPAIVSIGGRNLIEGVDYTVQFSAASPKKVGTYTMTIVATGNYTGTTKATYKINKAANPLKIKAKTAKVKFSKLKNKAQRLAVTKVIKFTKKGQGTLTYAKKSGNKKITINKKTGKVTIKKGLKKGTYKVKVKVKAKGNANYKASAYKTVTFKIIVK